MDCCRVVAAFTFLLLFFCSLQTVTVICVEFEVGGGKGWSIPPSKNGEFYNDWASKNRFNVGDTLHFEYKKDSVLVVSEEEYGKCRTAHPVFFSNNGNTVFTVDRPGLFYFISGVSGHCERGLKMIIKVLEPEIPPQSANDTATPTPKKSGGAALDMAGGTTAAVALFSFFGAFFI